MTWLHLLDFEKQKEAFLNTLGVVFQHVKISNQLNQQLT